MNKYETKTTEQCVDTALYKNLYDEINNREVAMEFVLNRITITLTRLVQTLITGSALALALLYEP
jgi:uncharacterized protein (DUF2461 family)